MFAATKVLIYVAQKNSLRVYAFMFCAITFACMKKMGTVSNFMLSDITRNSAKLLSANVLAQVVGLVVYPILTRMYSPADFGVFNLFVSIGSILILISLAEYEYAIVLPTTNKRAVGVFHVGLLTSLAIFVLLVFASFFSVPIAKLFNEPSLAKLLWLMPFYVFVSSVWMLLNYWYTRDKRFGAISGYQMSQSVISAGAKVGLGWAKMPFGLVYPTVVAPFVSLIISVLSVPKNILLPLFKFDRTEIGCAACEYSNFPKFSLPKSLINSLSANLPVLLLVPFFGAYQVGFLGMALTLAFRPISTVSASLYQVFFQRTTEQVNCGERIMPFFIKFVLYSLALLVPVFVVLSLVLPSFTGWLLGNEWSITGQYIRLLLPWLALNFITESVSYLVDVFCRQRTNLFFEIVYLFIRLSALLVGVSYGNFMLAIALYGIGNFLLKLVYLVWLLKLVKDYDQTIE